jgi:hypothetical protein
MAYSSVTKYLGLRNVTLGDESWLQDSVFNNSRIDLLAEILRNQTSSGSSMGIRTRLSSGVLVEGVTITPQADGSLIIDIGRGGTSGDVVKINGTIQTGA